MAGLATKFKPEITSQLCPFLGSTALGGKEVTHDLHPQHTHSRSACLPPTRTPPGTHLGASMFRGQTEPPGPPTLTALPGGRAAAPQLVLFLCPQGRRGRAIHSQNQLPEGTSLYCEITVSEVQVWDLSAPELTRLRQPQCCARFSLGNGRFRPSGAGHPAPEGVCVSEVSLARPPAAHG